MLRHNADPFRQVGISPTETTAWGSYLDELKGSMQMLSLSLAFLKRRKAQLLKDFRAKHPEVARKLAILSTSELNQLINRSNADLKHIAAATSTRFDPGQMSYERSDEALKTELQSLVIEARMRTLVHRKRGGDTARLKISQSAPSPRQKQLAAAAFHGDKL